ncbi:carbon-nitrogen hydrolase family protein [Yoonia litorea]|uniref:Predicted amidohydrolase n=1 Tax=Yoonia litorea TaxID=1123755 RepID=A0A1I6MHW5_9RHOB|nr:carbon-nitrogen hydrolase family protein [Yoonia litorea]SFS15197.1 Predicted amidohydrolase [Yoonia litorea]
MKIATCAYQPQWHPDRESLQAKLEARVADAARDGAEIIVFPEYAGVEAGLIGPSQDNSPTGWVASLMPHYDWWTELHSNLAQKYGLHILAGSLPRHAGRKATNAASFCAPTGKVVIQDKMILTPYERREMKLAAGDDLKLIDTPLGKIGILICYDSEFPLLARTLVAAGAEVILVPSCTEAPAGQTRVRQSCRARAIEGQCLVVQAPLAGIVSDCEIIDVSTGRAGIFCPPDIGLPPDGIIAQGLTDDTAWVIADVDLAPISAVRTTGHVGNFSHWEEQDSRLNHITTVSLR